MASSQQSTGAQTCTLATDHDLANLTGPTGGAHYALILDVANIVETEVLFAYMKRNVRSTDSERELMRVAIARGPSASPIIDSLILRLPSGIAGTFGIRQEGGTGRAIPWAVERVDG